MRNTSVTRRNLLKSGALAAMATLVPASAALADETPAKNRVCEILGIEKPVVQAIMFDMTNPELVAAVSNAGGLGVVTCTGIEEVQAVKALTDKPFAAAPAIADDETAEALKGEGVSIIVAGTVGFESADWLGDTTGIKFWKDHGFTVLSKSININLKTALAIQEAGADILIPVGYGAGGCAPRTTATYPMLLSEFKDQITIPMLAAGGVVDATTAAAGAAAGAEGAYCGTRFLVTEESNCCDEAKQIIIDTQSEDLLDMPTSLSGEWYSMVPCCHTPLTEKSVEMYRNGSSFDEITQYSGTNNLFWASMSAGNVDEYGVGMDRAVNLITGIKPIQDIVDEIAAPFLG